eukprot:SAG31_NODE_199_length_20573_cov_5.832129_13_plen_1802_part_00
MLNAPLLADPISIHSATRGSGAAVNTTGSVHASSGTANAKVPDITLRAVSASALRYFTDTRVKKEEKLLKKAASAHIFGCDVFADQPEILDRYNYESIDLLAKHREKATKELEKAKSATVQDALRIQSAEEQLAQIQRKHELEKPWPGRDCDGLSQKLNGPMLYGKYDEQFENFTEEKCLRQKLDDAQEKLDLTRLVRGENRMAQLQAVEAELEELKLEKTWSEVALASQKQRDTFITTRDVNRHIIKVDTANVGNIGKCGRYVELPEWKSKKDDKGHPFVGRADFIVSHCHDGPWEDLVEGVEEHASREPNVCYYYWIDLFAVNQHSQSSCQCSCCKSLKTTDAEMLKMANEANRQDLKELGLLIDNLTQGALVVMEPWDQPRAPTRSWCVYEMDRALNKFPVRVIMGKKEKRRMQQALEKNFKKLELAINAIDIGSAKTNRMKDKDQIMNGALITEILLKDPNQQVEQLLGLQQADLHKTAFSLGMDAKSIYEYETAFPGIKTSHGGISAVNQKVKQIMSRWLAESSEELLDRVEHIAPRLKPEYMKLEEENLTMSRDDNFLFVEQCFCRNRICLTHCLDRYPRLPSLLELLGWCCVLSSGALSFMAAIHADQIFKAPNALLWGLETGQPIELSEDVVFLNLYSGITFVAISCFLGPVLFVFGRECLDIQYRQQLRRRKLFRQCLSVSDASALRCDCLGCCGCGAGFLPMITLLFFFLFGIDGFLWAILAGMVLYITMGIAIQTAADHAALAKLRARAGVQFLNAGQREKAIDMMRKGSDNLRRFDGRDIAANFEQLPRLIEAYLAHGNAEAAKLCLSYLDAAIQRNDRTSRKCTAAMCSDRCGKSSEAYGVDLKPPLAVQQGRMLMRRVEALLKFKQSEDDVKMTIDMALKKGADQLPSLDRSSDVPVSIVNVIDDQVKSNHHRYTSEYWDICTCCKRSKERLKQSGWLKIAVVVMLITVLAAVQGIGVVIGGLLMASPAIIFYCIVPCYYLSKYGRDDCVCKSGDKCGSCGCMCIILVWVMTVTSCCAVFTTVGVSGVSNCAYIVEWSTQPVGSSIEEFAVAGCYRAAGNNQFESAVNFPLDMVGIFNGAARNYARWACGNETCEPFPPQMLELPIARQQLHWSGEDGQWSFSGPCARCGVTCVTRVIGQSLSDVEVNCSDTYDSGFVNDNSLMCVVPEYPGPKLWARSLLDGPSLAVGPPVDSWERQVNGEWQNAEGSLIVRRGGIMTVLTVGSHLAGQFWRAAAPYYENCRSRTWQRFFTYSGATVNRNSSFERASNGTVMEWNYGGAWHCGINTTDQQWKFSVEPNATVCTSDAQSLWGFTPNQGDPGLIIGTGNGSTVLYLGPRQWFFLFVAAGPLLLVFFTMVCLQYCCGFLCIQGQNPLFKNCTRTTTATEEKYCGCATISVAIICCPWSLGGSMLVCLCPLDVRNVTRKPRASVQVVAPMQTQKSLRNSERLRSQEKLKQELVQRRAKWKNLIDKMKHESNRTPVTLNLVENAPMTTPTPSAGQCRDGSLITIDVESGVRSEPVLVQRAVAISKRNAQPDNVLELQEKSPTLVADQVHDLKSVLRRILGLDPPIVDTAADVGRYEIALGEPKFLRWAEWIPPQQIESPVPWVERWIALSDDSCEGLPGVFPGILLGVTRTWKHVDIEFFGLMLILSIVLGLWWWLLAVLFTVVCVALCVSAVNREGGWVKHGPSLYGQFRNACNLLCIHTREAGHTLTNVPSIPKVASRRIAPNLVEQLTLVEQGQASQPQEQSTEPPSPPEPEPEPEPELELEPKPEPKPKPEPEPNSE